MEDYVVYGDDEFELPDFPLEKPADFQIFESDCKLYPSLLEQLRSMYYECETSDTIAFITGNLNRLLSRNAAIVYSWNGNQGNIPVRKFVTMKVLMGSFDQSSFTKQPFLMDSVCLHCLYCLY